MFLYLCPLLLLLSFLLFIIPVVLNQCIHTYIHKSRTETAKACNGEFPPLDFLTIATETVHQAVEDDVRADLEALGFTINPVRVLKDEYNAEQVAGNFHFSTFLFCFFLSCRVIYIYIYINISYSSIRLSYMPPACVPSVAGGSYIVTTPMMKT